MLPFFPLQSPIQSPPSPPTSPVVAPTSRPWQVVVAVRRRPPWPWRAPREPRGTGSSGAVHGVSSENAMAWRFRWAVIGSWKIMMMLKSGRAKIGIQKWCIDVYSYSSYIKKHINIVQHRIHTVHGSVNVLMLLWGLLHILGQGAFAVRFKEGGLVMLDAQGSGRCNMNKSLDKSDAPPKN